VQQSGLVHNKNFMNGKITGVPLSKNQNEYMGMNQAGKAGII
jgi:hypothetical protein